MIDSLLPTFPQSTLRLLSAAFPTHAVHGFDSWRGLPEAWRTAGASFSVNFTQKGAFDLGGKVPCCFADNVHLHAGEFDTALPRFLAEEAAAASQEPPIALLHIDCDLYSSTLTVLEHLARRLRPGSIVIFDELINYPTYRDHELKAAREVFRRHAICPEPIAVKRPGMLLKRELWSKKELMPLQQSVAFRIRDTLL